MPKPKQVTWQVEAIPRGTDPLMGAEIVQLTSAPVITHDIYLEQIYASTDGSRIGLFRSWFPDLRRLPEMWVCDLETRQTTCIGEASDSSGIASNRFLDTLYYIRPVSGGEHSLVRLNLKTLEREDVFTFSDCPLPRSGAISADERYYVGGLRIEGTLWGLYRIDLSRGTWEVFHEHQDILNPHLQFQPTPGNTLLVQWNRGGIVDADDNIIQLVGEEGASLYLVDVDGSNYRRLPVGKPHTTPVTGHECWIGKEQRILLTSREGYVHTAAGGDEQASLVCQVPGYNHISSSVDGRFFTVDDFRNGRLYVGSLKSNRVLPICDSGASCGRPQYTHAHPYLTPDNRHVIYNSDRTGICQVYAAVVPDGFLEQLL